MRGSALSGQYPGPPRSPRARHRAGGSWRAEIFQIFQIFETLEPNVYEQGGGDTWHRVAPGWAVCHSTPTSRLSKMLNLTSPVSSLPPVLRIIFQTELPQAPPSCWNGHRVLLHQDGTVAWIFPYILVDGCFYPAEGTEHTGHKCGRSQTFPSATARSGATCETLPQSQLCSRLHADTAWPPHIAPSLGRVAWLVQTSVSALFLAFRPYLAARPGGSVQAGRGSRQGTWWMLLPTPSRQRQLRP